MQEELHLYKVDMKYDYHRATLKDIDILVRTRVEVLRAANHLDDDVDMSEVEQASREYYMKALQDGSHTAYLVYENGSCIGTGGISYYRVMPTYHIPTGRKAYIMNMYTKPEYRRQGIARKMLDLLIQDARAQGIYDISLEATDEGRLLYENYGFVDMDCEMMIPRVECDDIRIGSVEDRSDIVSERDRQ